MLGIPTFESQNEMAFTHRVVKGVICNFTNNETHNPMGECHLAIATHVRIPRIIVRLMVNILNLKGYFALERRLN